MRSHLTPSEAALWRQLSARRLDGVAFKRQAPVGNFVADFLAPSRKLIVEVDGPYHARRRGADARRDAKLRRWGYRVLRLEDALVMGDMARALELIRRAL
jgi:very-short-patch-repair endonuclease